MPATFKHILLLINPVAGTSVSRRFQKKLPDILSRLNFKLKILTSEKAGDIEKLARENAAPETLIVVAGGDGTVREAALGLRHTGAVMGILPTGSGNGFARHLGIDMNPEKALVELLTTSQIIEADMAQLNEHFFINMAGIGFDGQVAKTFSEDGKRGLRTYIKHTLWNYPRVKEFEYNLQSAHSTVNGIAWMITMANAREFGNGAQIAPNASITDGELDIAIVRRPSWFQIPGLLFAVMTGREHSGLIQRLRLSTFSLQLNSFQPMHLDGEFVGQHQTLDVKANKGCIRLAVPENKSIF